MSQHIFGEATADASPYSVIYSWFSLRFAMPMAAALMVVLGTGTVYAAGGALPGDTLYAVKVSVTEPMREVLAFSQTAKADFHTNVVQERLEEAETLVSQGRLTESTTKALEENLNKHVAAAQTITKTLAEGDPDTAADMATALDSSLSAHGAILARLGDDSEDDHARQYSARLALNVGMVRIPQEVREEKQNTSTIHSATSLVQTAQTISEPTLVAGETMRKDAEQEEMEQRQSKDRSLLKRKEKASGQLAEVRKQFEKTKGSFGTSTAQKVESRFQEIQQQIEAGNTADALRGGVELYTFIKAGQKFNGDILERLIIGKDNRQDKEGRENADGSDD